MTAAGRPKADYAPDHLVWSFSLVQMADGKKVPSVVDLSKTNLLHGEATCQEGRGSERHENL